LIDLFLLSAVQEGGMRVCRFAYDGIVLTGYYCDSHVIPIDQAAEFYSRDQDEDLLIGASDNLLDLLPPHGASFPQAREIHGWVEDLDFSLVEDLAIPISEIELLKPIPSPSKLFFLAGNYAKHVQERGGTTAERDETFPYVFMKPASTTLTDPGGPIVIPEISPDRIDWECELGVVIGRRCRRVSEEEALKYVAGYTIVNDISDRGFRPNPARKVRERDRFFDWMHGKWHDSSCPMGPCILSSHAVVDPQSMAIRLTVNGEVKQNASTAEMVFPVAAVIAFLSQFVTLEPGDVIATGTPSGVGSATDQYLKPGDIVQATIEPIGTLENPVVAEDEIIESDDAEDTIA
jgi:2-keto-4-pentenoate hydratase/2-oxohepta-3-ene-1,7-dioic acid hydratase in catechol pathway